MKFGVCAPINSEQLIIQAGFDYLEPTMQDIDKLTYEQFDEIETKILSACCLMSGGFMLFDDDWREKTELYLEGVLAKAGKFRLQKVVFGGGGFRNIPLGTDKEKVAERFNDFLTMLSAIAKKNEIIVCIEPLNKKECNTINTTKQAMEIITRLKINNLKLLVDLYHFAAEEEDFENIVTYKNYIEHIHIAKPVERTCPYDGDGYDYTPFFETLKRSGYQKTISIESSGTNQLDSLLKAKELFNKML